jgi:ubiquinone/menaquinone biosynthesis C-methylase UbiE
MDSSQPDSKDWFDVSNFEKAYKIRPGKVIARIGKAAYGDDYPEEAEPFSFVTKTDLARMARLLTVGSGCILVDLGSGRGGPGLWLARETGADLVGIDLSANAIAQATQRIPEFGLDGHARYLQGNLCATGLPDQSCDAAVSIDVLMFIQDQPAVMQEVARILRPRAPFVFTAFEDRGTERYRLPLQDNGFNVEVYEEKPDWRRRQLALYERTVAKQDTLIEEMGEGGRVLIAEAEYLLADGLENTRHVFVAARRM